MTGMTVMSDLKSGFADFFGGPQKMQESARKKLGKIKSQLEEELREDLDADYRSFFNEALVLVNQALGSQFIGKSQLVKIHELLAEYCDAYLERFVELKVPEGKTEEDIFREIQSRLEPDMVAHTNFFYIIVVMKALKEMDEFFAIQRS